MIYQQLILMKLLVKLLHLQFQIKILKWKKEFYIGLKKMVKYINLDIIKTDPLEDLN